MGKEAYFLFTVPVGVPFGGLGEHEPLIVDFFLPVVYRSNWRRPCTIKGSDWASETARFFDLECKREQEHPVPVQMKGKLRQV